MVPTSFDVEVKLDHCPEHRIRPNLQLEIFYTIGSSAVLNNANVISINYDNPSNTATAVLRFPSDMGSTPFKDRKSLV